MQKELTKYSIDNASRMVEFYRNKKFSLIKYLRIAQWERRHRFWVNRLEELN